MKLFVLSGFLSNCSGTLHLGFEFVVFGPAGSREFLGFGRPRRPPKNILEGGGLAPTFWNGFWGRRGRPDPKNRPFPAGPKTMYSNVLKTQVYPGTLL